MRNVVSTSIIFTILLVACASGQTSQAEDAHKHAATRQLMQVVGTAGLLQQILDQTIDLQVATMRRLRPDISDSFWDRFTSEFKQDANPQELIDLMVPIYEKHFSQDEIEQLVSFYSSPLGKKISTTLPAIQSESLEAGKEWGATIAKRLEERMNNELEHEKNGKKPSTGLQQD